MSDRYPGYDVLAKRNTPSWNEQTRRVIDERLALEPQMHRFFDDSEWPTLHAICARIIPQPAGRAAVPLPAMLDQKLTENGGEGYRDARLPPMREAWRRALQAIDAEAAACHKQKFCALSPLEQDALLTDLQTGKTKTAAWKGLPPALFFRERLLRDIVTLYYAHPSAWSEIGFGGPASPRGYVRMNYDRRDPWEAAEAKPGQVAKARRQNRHVG
jgi:hypothetical protein